MVPAMLIFGDSLIDNGNNNNLPSFAKANYYFISRKELGCTESTELLGLPLTPAYSEASGDKVLHGVNYASAAAGILDATGRNFLMLWFFVGMGSNDYLNNHLMPNYPTRNQYNAEEYAHLLAQTYNTQLTVRNKLYNLGARKIVIAGQGLMGCIPSILAQSASGRCSEEVNLLVQPFNSNVKTVGCCGIGRNRGQITCLPFQTTEAVNALMGMIAFNGNYEFNPRLFTLL
ncbi:hypothetical protein AAHE18_19G000600 [Arachis hypogaea]